jgi:PAS domain S-box-containing protein
MTPAQPTPNEAGRIQALRQYAVLDTLPEQTLDDLTALAAQICGAPIALISLVDEHRQWFKAKVGLKMGETARDISFCSHAVNQKEMFIVPDATRDERFADNPLVTGDPRIRFYAGAPLVNPENAAVGTLCVIDHVPRNLTPAQKQALHLLGRQVMTHLELRRRTRELSGLAAIVEYSDDAIIGKDLYSIISSWNKGAEKLFGYTATEMIGTSIMRLIPSDRQEEESHILGKIRRGESVEHFETLRRTKDGRLINVSVTASPIKDAEGTVIGVSKVARDISEQKQSQEMLTLLNTCVANLNDIVLVTQAEPINEPGPSIVFANPAFERITGYTAAEALGKSPRFLQGEKTDPLVLAEIRRALAQQRPIRRQIINYGKDGTEYWLDIDIVPILDSTGRCTHFGAIERDITREKKTQEQLLWKTAFFEAQVNSALDGILVVDNAGKKILQNERMIELWNIPRAFADEADDHRQLEWVASQVKNPRQFIEKVTYLHAHHDEISHDEIELIDGRVFDRYSAPVLGQDGKYYGRIWSFRDNTGRKQIEKALQKERDFISAVVATVGSLVVVLDRQARIVRFNRACERLTGYSFVDVQGQNLIDLLILPEERATTTAEFANLCAGQFPNTFENHWLNRDGSSRVIAWSNTALVDAEGQVEYVIGTGTDITERKRVEEAQQASEERYRTLFEYAPDGIVIANSESYYLDGNASICRMLGYTRDELIGLHASNIVVESEIPQIAPALNAIQAKTDYHRAWQFRRKDGSIFTADVIATLMPDGNLMAMIRDITEKKRAEEQIAEQAAFMDKAQDAILVRDLEGKILFWNKGAERMYGWMRQEVLGRNIGGLLYSDPNKFVEVNGLTISQGEWHGELQHQTKDRGAITIEARWTLIRDNEGRPKSVLAINTDITERKKIEAQFMRAQRMESIGTLAGGIAHDLNNILAPIMMSIDILKTLSNNPQAGKILETIEISARRGADIVRQVLSFARGLEGERIEIQPKHLLKDLESIIKDTFPKDIRLQFSIPNEIWTILGDPTQVHQILLNLCVNARDAMPNGGNLTIGVENCVLDEQYVAMNMQARPGRYVNISVTDSGTGMTPELINKIFEPFFTTKELTKGTGLGLSTVLAIVKSHGGIINVYSEPGKGTTFKVYLPATEAAPGARNDPAELVSLPRGNGETVLVVDDEASILTITSQTLQAFGYRVLTATDGADAVAIYAQHRREIAVVLTDMMMPVMDGPAMIHALMRINPAIKIVAASGLNANGNAAKMLGAGVKHFLTKPYTAGTLLKTMRAILNET